jgi:long-subunit fatty acid transport protein
MKRPPLRLALLTCLVGLAGSESVARANPADAFGLGSRSTAMGGAVAADVSDFSANYYNPAGLALAKHLEVSVGYMRADHFLYTNGVDNGVDPVKGLVGGIVAPGTLFHVPFALGVALMLPDDRLSRVVALPEGQPVWELYDNRNQRLYVATNLAISPWPWLQVGGGIGFMAATQGTLSITGSAAVLDVDASQLRHEVDADLTAIRYPQVGVRVTPSKRVAIAVVYRGQFTENLDLSATLKGDIKLYPTGSALTTAFYAIQTDSVDDFLPQQAVLGTSFLVTDDLHVNFDLTYVNWSSYVSPVAAVDIKLNIPAPKGGWPVGIVPPSTPVPVPVIPIDMHDTVVPRLGLEWRAFDKQSWQGFVRGGYEYDRTPIPAQTGLTNYIDRDRHAFSLGLGVNIRHLPIELPGELRFDGHVQLSELFQGTTLKTNPADFVGDYTAGGHIWNLGGTLTMAF